MPIRKTPLIVGEYYHLYNRGNSKQTIFNSPCDYQRLQILLYLSNSFSGWEIRELDQNDIFDLDRGEQLLAVAAYCLMPNHFHLLVTPLVERGVERFMQKLSTGYSMYFNTKHRRSGSLFEGRFKAKLATDDRYLRYLYSYILLNPVKLFQSDWREKGLRNVTGTKKFLNEYLYSSYVDEVIIRPESAILNRAPFPNYFTDKRQLDDELLEWLNYDDSF